jgi:hypothetical protein
MKNVTKRVKQEEAPDKRKWKRHPVRVLRFTGEQTSNQVEIFRSKPISFPRYLEYIEIIYRFIDV